MARAVIDSRVLFRMVAAALKAALDDASGTPANLYLPGEPDPEDQSRPWVTLDAIDTSRVGGSRGGDSAPDHAEVEVRCSVFGPDSDTLADLGALDSISALVARTLARSELDDASTSHTLRLFDARETEAAVPDDSGRIRARSVVCPGRAYRLSGTALE